jgi:hypothetical protein
MMAEMRQSFPPFMPQDVVEDLETSLEKIDFEPMAVEAYQKYVSSEDAAQVIAFYKTAAGRHLVGALPQITLEMQADGTKAGTKVVQEVITRHMDEIKAAATKYRDANSDEPRITAPN